MDIAGVQAPETQVERVWLIRCSVSRMRHRLEHLPVLTRRQPRAPFEQSPKERSVLVSNCGGNIFGRAAFGFEQSFGVFNSQVLDITHEGGARGSFEAPL